MVYAAYFSTIALILIGIVVGQRERKQQLEKRLALLLQQEVKQLQNNLENNKNDIQKESFLNRIVAPNLRRVKLYFKRNLTIEKRNKIELKLVQAGSPFGMTAVEYRIFQLCILIIVPPLFTLYGWFLRASIGMLAVITIAGIVLSLYIPAYYLKKKALRRQRIAVKEMPDFLDLLTVSIEAGLGFDSALSKVVSKKNGVLSEEFQRCLEEIRLGKTRKEALSGIRDRVAADDVSSFIGSIIQAEQLGIGMAQILNVQSYEMRVKRKQRAEEEAMKAPIKMLFPLVLFIFPGLFIVLLGPAVIGLLEAF